VKKSRFSEEQIVAILNEAEAGVPVADLVRRRGPGKQAPSEGIVPASSPLRKQSRHPASGEARGEGDRQWCLGRYGLDDLGLEQA
jgi:hypothetical protein